MKVEYFKEYSQCLQRDMEWQVFGHDGMPILAFPSQDGRYFDFSNNGMVDCISQYVEDGKVQVFCCDSVDVEGWSLKDGDGLARSYIVEQFYYYIVDELVPRIKELNKNAEDGILTTGCSMGATHAANFFFRRPDIFRGCIALSGYYDSDLFFDNYCDERIYKNSPIKYIEGMSYDHPYIEKYRQSDIILCCGQGAWETEMIYATGRMKELLDYKDVPAWIDFWGYDVAHDWPWWRIQLPYFLGKLLGE